MVRVPIRRKPYREDHSSFITVPQINIPFASVFDMQRQRVPPSECASLPDLQHLCISLLVLLDILRNLAQNREYVKKVKYFQSIEKRRALGKRDFL